MEALQAGLGCGLCRWLFWSRKEPHACPPLLWPVTFARGSLQPSKPETQPSLPSWVPWPMASFCVSCRWASESAHPTLLPSDPTSFAAARELAVPPSLLGDVPPRAVTREFQFPEEPSNCMAVGSPRASRSLTLWALIQPGKQDSWP